MRDIEVKISPLIASQFPSFYQEEGPNFIMFVKAYYEFLEQNFQLLTLKSNTDFNIGDTVTQENVTGEIVAFIGSDVLVLVNGFDTFKCYTVCADLTPITSSSGGFTNILKGGATRRLGSLFMSRNLTNIRDIDRTLDLFIVHFKEKYLKNIEFDIATNKVLLVKNSLDLYRSKGTARSIDLFFRLLYGSKADVYFPGDDLFRSSDAEWYKPRYIEINVSNTKRAVDLVNKQIYGISSGATAFVEKYVRKKLSTGYIDVLYVSSISGQFILNEQIKHDTLYVDSPRIIGSLSNISLITKASNFEVGDQVNITSLSGEAATARVTGTTQSIGLVDFTLTNSGYGYSVNTDGNTNYTDTITSDKIIIINKIAVGNLVSGVAIANGGYGYTNNDILVISSPISNAEIKVTTNLQGNVIQGVVTKTGSGLLYTNTSFKDYKAGSDSTFQPYHSNGQVSAGNNATITVTFVKPHEYFTFDETIKEKLFYYTFSNCYNESVLAAGSSIRIGNNYSNAVNAIIISKTLVSTTNGSFYVNILNNANTINSQYIFAEGAATANAKIIAVSEASVEGNFMHVNDTGVLTVTPDTGLLTSIAVGDTLYQLDDIGNIATSAIVTKVSSSLASATITFKSLDGVFDSRKTIYVLGKAITATYSDIQLTLGVYNTSNTFVDTWAPQIFSTNTGIYGYASVVSSGVDASFQVATIDNAESVLLNTDMLSSYANVSLSASQYNLPQDVTANSSSPMFNALHFEPIVIGSIATLGGINPGEGYNYNPATAVIQPYISGFQRHDYIFTISDLTGSFGVGEKLLQDYQDHTWSMKLANTANLRLGQFIHLSNTSLGGNTGYLANGTILSIDSNNNIVVVNNLAGTVLTGNTYSSYTNNALSANFINVSVYAVNSNTNYPLYYANSIYENKQAAAVITDFNETAVYAKRIQFDNHFTAGQTVTGQLTGASANLVAIAYDYSTPVIGFNAQVDTVALTANGTLTSLEITDSGFGFTDGQTVNYISVDGQESGTGRGYNTPVGTSAGYYKSSRGFTSDTSKLFDGDYYQEYSYEVISRFPLEKYATMFKKVMHTAGTRFFGKVLIDTTTKIVNNGESKIKAANTQIVIS